MNTLHEKLYHTSDFLTGVELVSIRGSMAEKSAGKARDFANELVGCEEVDWVSITDNAGGNPQMAPQALGKPILYAGKEVVIHLTCKDMNRNGLESEAWSLNSEGFHNILAMTGDYPIDGNEGAAKPVFDIDSVGLISMLSKMNKGFHQESRVSKKIRKHEETDFVIGAVASNFKLLEAEVMPQYYKLQKKVECGANFIINQIGFDSRKVDELRQYMDNHEMKDIPLIGNTYVLNSRVAQVFYDKRIPGVVVSKDLLDVCLKHGKSQDKGRGFFYEFAAKQMAIYKGLGYRGAYLGGVYDFDAIQEILEIEKSFSKDDWKQFSTEIKFSQSGEYYFYSQDSKTGLSDSTQRNSKTKGSSNGKSSIVFSFSRWVHNTLFTEGTFLSNWGTKASKNSKDPSQGPKLVRAAESVSKLALFDCKDCGDCSLPDMAFLCPESQCAKNQRNGPCGGTKQGKCEVAGYDDCIWVRTYDRLKDKGEEKHLLDHSPVVQNQALRGTSSWANHWLGKDHAGAKVNQILKKDSEKEKIAN